MTYHPEGKLFDTPENQAALASPAALADACKMKPYWKAVLFCVTAATTSLLNFPACGGSFPGMKARSVSGREPFGILPIISRVNRPVCFVVEGFSSDESGRPTARSFPQKSPGKVLARTARQSYPGRYCGSTYHPSGTVRGVLPM